MSAAREADLIAAWGLTRDGAAFETRYGNRLTPVLTRDGRFAMLKIIASDDEKPGIEALRYFGGRGAAALYESAEDAELLERLADTQSLIALAQTDDNRATQIICDVIAVLHAPRSAARPEGLHDLGARFGALRRQAERTDLPARARRLLRAGWKTVSELFAGNRLAIVLHGDVHHDNILDDGAGNWRAIDPKGVWGDPGYDYANIFLNPFALPDLVVKSVARRAEIVARARGAPVEEVLAWAEAHAMLSASWTLSAGQDPAFAWDVAEIAHAERG